MTCIAVAVRTGFCGSFRKVHPVGQKGAWIGQGLILQVAVARKTPAVIDVTARIFQFLAPVDLCRILEGFAPHIVCACYGLGEQIMGQAVVGKMTVVALRLEPKTVVPAVHVHLKGRYEGLHCVAGTAKISAGRSFRDLEGGDRNRYANNHPDYY